MRWSRQELYNSRGTVQADIDDNWAPRLGFVWDALGNGKSKIFGHWGYFYESIPMDIVIRSFGDGNIVVNTYNFSDDEWNFQQPPPDQAPRPPAFATGAVSRRSIQILRGSTCRSRRSAPSTSFPRTTLSD